MDGLMLCNAPLPLCTLASMSERVTASFLKRAGSYSYNSLLPSQGAISMVVGGFNSFSALLMRLWPDWVAVWGRSEVEIVQP